MTLWALRSGPRSRAVPVDGFQTDMQLRQGVAVVGRVCGHDGAFNLAQLFVAVQHELYGCPGQWRSFLRDRCDAPVARHVAVAGLRVQFAPQQGEQARFAGAICADDAHPPPRVQLHRGVFDETPRAAGQGELTKLDQNLLKNRGCGPRILAAGGCELVANRYAP